jgi:type I restriction enzyme S subunit
MRWHKDNTKNEHDKFSIKKNSILIEKRMDTKKLRQKILDLAIRGKLVPQDPNDEPASVLIEKIRAEKERLIKEKKIKRDKNESVTFQGDDKSPYEKLITNYELKITDVPFEVPDSWVWCRLGHLCEYGTCSNANPSDIPDEAWILDLEDVEKDTAKLLQRVLKIDKATTSTRHSFEKGNVLYSKLRTYLNKVLVADMNGFCTTEILPLDFRGFVVPEFARHVLMSQMFLNYTTQCGYGVKMPRLGTNDGKNAFFPLPPLKEQYRIVYKIESLFALIDEIESNKLSLEQFVKQAKSKVLDLAIHGKLVPQDPNDEPASVLLERIKNEHKTKEKTTDNSQNKQFLQMPDNWSVCNLSDICIFERGITFPSSAKQTHKFLNSIACVRTANVQEILELDDLWYIDKIFLKNNPNKLLREKDIIMSSANSRELVGKTSLVENLQQEMTFGGFVLVIRTFQNSKYLFYLMRNYFFKGLFAENSTQTTNIANINTMILGNFEVQLPPLDEQQRIVAKIEQIFTQLNTIEQSIKALPISAISTHPFR